MTVSRKNDNGRVNVGRFRRDLLSWYDKHRRVLPWRVLPSQTADPYHVWLSEIMLQQTTVPTVGPYFMKFLEKWPSVHDLAAAAQDEVMHEWAGLGYYARARNLHKCAKTVSMDLKGIFPQTQEGLEALPGIGPYTSAAIAAIAFDKPATVVDGNVERVTARVFKITKPLPESKSEIRQAAAILSEKQKNRPGDFAQAMMDLGATICTPTSPKCGQCPVSSQCTGREIADTLPARAKKKPKPQKYGHFYWITRPNGAVLFERRPEKGMLGGMLGLPTSEWQPKGNAETMPQPLKALKATWHSPEKATKIRHSFTHFDLDLVLCRAELGAQQQIQGENFCWVDIKDIPELGLPTLFQKAVKLMM